MYYFRKYMGVCKGDKCNTDTNPANHEQIDLQWQKMWKEVVSQLLELAVRSNKNWKFLIYKKTFNIIGIIET